MKMTLGQKNPKLLRQKAQKKTNQRKAPVVKKHHPELYISQSQPKAALVALFMKEKESCGNYLQEDQIVKSCG